LILLQKTHDNKMKHSGYGNGMMQVAMHSSKGRTKTKGEGILLPSPQEQDSMLEQKESTGKAMLIL